ncbi:hypothetical protein HO133_003973 [Letharia lupina]|uniref:Uncharacterized protein n=2 Tax=Letharia TaxID=112415 RepID=A0A8H6CA67_9LECA|nr:uncharacterized protein HO133_003973 [Letharia lupina]XP_037158017.1 uncharacterized protein HO173_013273 [Letharia columbiana]KAF6219504.1 hypothetical protein HO133_003973 [Letharia lupina]KAF6223143.1 hypothetical protein HO173_013273 [Letharia columbiana]
MTEWTKKKYNEAYTEYMPWIEDKVLGYWGENKTSYTAKDKLNTDVTGDKNVQAIQGGIAEGVGGQFSSGGLLGGVGDMTSKEGVNRAERGDPGLDPKELEKLNAQKKQKGWTETLSMGYMGGSK